MFECFLRVKTRYSRKKNKVWVSWRNPLVGLVWPEPVGIPPGQANFKTMKHAVYTKKILGAKDIQDDDQFASDTTGVTILPQSNGFGTFLQEHRKQVLATFMLVHELQ